MTYILRGIIGLTVLLFFASCNKPVGGDSTGPVSGDSIPLRLPVAYISTDSLLSNYQFVVDKNEEILKNLENKRLDINKRSDKLQKDILEYRQKVQMNAYYSRERQEQAETQLGREQQNLEKLAADADREIGIQQQTLQLSLQDSLNLAIREFNQGKYQIIFSNAGASTFFYMDESYDITKEVTDFLNARYIPTKK